MESKIILGDCVDILKTLPDESIDLVITSPPYFNIYKKYQRANGYHYNQDFGEPLYTIEDSSRELLRVLKDNGTYCLNLGFSYGETGVLRPFYIVERLIKMGWICVDIIIWYKPNPIPIKNRLSNAYEYIFILSKTPIWKSKKNITYEQNVWKIPVERGYIKGVPSFPKELVKKCIELFSNENDVILDNYCGSGTTCLIAKILNRKYIGIEINKKYFNIAKKRIEEHLKSKV